MLSGFGFLHRNDVFFGELATSQYWLSSSPSMSISLAGLVNAGTPAWNGNSAIGEAFHPYAHKRGNAATPTRQTDLLCGAHLYMS